MARRIHDSVIKGELDNRERGRIRGRIWLLGHDQPVVLDLSGNCRRDLAGCVITFVNESPTAAVDRPPPARGPDERASDLAIEQKGAAGDITASPTGRASDVA